MISRFITGTTVNRFAFFATCLLLGTPACSTTASHSKSVPDFAGHFYSKIGHVNKVAGQGQHLCVEAAVPNSEAEPDGKDGMKALQIGRVRRLPQTSTEALTAALLKWEELPDKRSTASICFHAPGATAIRLGITVTKIPSGTVFRFFSAPGRDSVTVPGEDILLLLQSNADAGETGVEAETYWAPSIRGSKVVMQIELASSVDPEALKIHVARLSGIFFHGLSPKTSEGSNSTGKQ